MPITINGTTGISGVDGSAGTPAVIGSDADTGLVFAAGQVSASVNGVAGNVPLVSGTVQNSTSGTSIDFTGIPSWVKRVTVIFQGVSTSGTSPIEVRLGTSAGVEATGYGFSVNAVGSTANINSSNTGFPVTSISNSLASNSLRGTVTLLNLATSNIWLATLVMADATNLVNFYGAGSKGIASALDRIRITTVNGTDTFDAGSINILYE